MKLPIYILLLIFSSNYINIKSAAQITGDLDTTPLIRTSSGATFLPGYHLLPPGPVDDPANVNPNIKAFKKAVKENNINEVTRLIELDKKNIDPSKFETLLVNSKIGSPPVLHYAISNEDIPLVKLLIDNGAELNSFNFDALYIAQTYGNIDDIIKLIEAKKEENSRPEASVRNKSLELLDAVKKNDITRAIKLIAAGADVNYKVDKNTSRPIIDLAITPQMVNLLIDHGADINGIWKESNGITRTALVSMIHKNILENPYIPENIKILLAYGADINFKNSLGQTPIDIARQLREEYKNLPLVPKTIKKYLENIQKIIDLLKAEPKRRLDEQKKFFDAELKNKIQATTILPSVLTDIVVDYAGFEQADYSEFIKRKREAALKSEKKL